MFSGPDQLRSIIGDFKNILTAEHQVSKAPTGLDTALECLQDPVPSAFLIAGVDAWFSYLLATNAKPQLKAPLQALSVADLKTVVSEVSQIDVHTTVQDLRRHALESSHRGGSRQTILASNESSDPPHPKRPRLDLACLQQPPSRQTTAVEAINPSEIPIYPMPDIVDQAGTRFRTNDDNPQPDYDRPEAGNLPFVFPDYICEAISKDGKKAAIQAFFPPDPTQTRLVLDIAARDVQHIARELFGTYIREEGQQRVVVFAHGSTMKIKGSVLFEGVETTAVSRILGDTISTALQHSPQRGEELETGKRLSDCMSLEVWGVVDRPCRLSFVLAPEILSLIIRRLWHGQAVDINPQSFLISPPLT
ncbi:hypothetical protein CI238_13200 [Colletotrichum incanum]|uniref:Uncharacterized protein n=1 Tax=Colletotrichum incanum TaxID=1573173 RepID=A0A166UQK5_COLIC|nr:hypothetical protein CI238_13200 [Colletotrichum incanum]